MRIKRIRWRRFAKPSIFLGQHFIDIYRNEEICFAEWLLHMGVIEAPVCNLSEVTEAGMPDESTGSGKGARFVQNYAPVGIVASAVIALISNAFVTWLNGKNQFYLEKQKAEINFALEAVKTGDPETAKANLKFLIEAGLIEDQNGHISKLVGANKVLVLPSNDREHLGKILEFLKSIPSKKAE
jgi:hypothetical protein